MRSRPSIVAAALASAWLLAWAPLLLLDGSATPVETWIGGIAGLLAAVALGFFVSLSGSMLGFFGPFALLMIPFLMPPTLVGAALRAMLRRLGRGRLSAPAA